MYKKVLNRNVLHKIHVIIFTDNNYLYMHVIKTILFYLIGE